MLRRNGPVVKSVQSVLRLEGSLWGERFVEEVVPGARQQFNSPMYVHKIWTTATVYRIIRPHHGIT